MFKYLSLCCKHCIAIDFFSFVFKITALAAYTTLACTEMILKIVLTAGFEFGSRKLEANYSKQDIPCCNISFIGAKKPQHFLRNKNNKDL